MKKLLFTLMESGVTAFSCLAQTTTNASSGWGGKLNIGAEGGLPLGDAGTAYSAIIGGSLKYEFPTVTNTYFTLSAGYNSYLLKSKYKDLGVSSSEGFVPLKAGIKYYAGGGFFLEGQAGIVFATESGGGHAFVYSPGLGYTFNGGFEAGLRYEAWSNNGTTGQMGLRLGFRF